MALPSPKPGLVISYSFLWHDEHRKGRDEGAKNRPCVIVTATLRTTDGETMVRVAPITHSPPDDQRSWVMLDEMNVFAWPGFDLRPIGRGTDRFDYGFLPPRFFADLVVGVREIWSAGRGKPTPRD
jgi:hypothetical protein